MKLLKSFFAVAGILYASVLVAQPATAFEVTGQLKGPYSGRIFIYFEDHFRQKDSISSELHNGRFHFSCTADLPVLAHLHMDQTSITEDLFIDSKRVYVACTNQLSVSNEGKDTMNWLHIDSVGGSKLEAEKRTFFHSMGVTGRMDLDKVAPSVYYQRLGSLVQRHRTNKLSAYLLSISTNLNYRQLQSLYAGLDSSLYHSYEMRSAFKLVQMKERELAGLLHAGKPFHDVLLPDAEDKIVDINQLPGDYLLISLWASWCAPCRKESPVLREWYTRYKDKGLAIVGVSLDGSKPKWTNAVKQDDPAWPQLIDTSGFRGNLALYYGIDAIPMFFLLDKERRIVMTGSLEGIAKKLEEVQ
jgi:thiol-disulfide isomerase/thioredoxin